MDRLLKGWGVEFDVAKVVSDMTFKTMINRTGRPEEAATVLSLNKDAMSSEDVLTAQLDNLLVPYSGVFTGTPKEGLKQTILLKTSQNSDMTDKIMAEFGGGGKDFKPSGKQHVLATRLVGKFKTAFPDGKPGEKAAEKKENGDQKDGEEKKDESKPDSSLKESTTDGVVVLVGDSDLIYDPVCAQVQNIFGMRVVTTPNGNLSFAQGMIEQLAGDSNLIAVRSRATLNRPFTVVKRMEEKAQDTFRSKIKELESSLQETQQKLNELQRTKESGQRFILSPEQQQELVKFREKEATMKRELKEVRKALRREIDSMENQLKWINIAGMPFVVSLSGIVLAVLKRKRTAAQ
jgi:ABC-type uncharacterized transport system involved in gliding motility auxiliary subunit